MPIDKDSGASKKTNRIDKNRKKAHSTDPEQVSMTSAGKTTKKRRRFRLSWKGWIAATATIATAILCVYSWQSQPDEIERLSLTHLDELKHQALAYNVESSYQNTALTADYTVYGESLNFYQNSYAPLENDPYYGRNVMVKNLETGAETVFTETGGADSGILLGTLDPGVYEIYIYDGYEKKRAAASEEINEQILTTIRRDHQVNIVELIASKDYLNDFGIEQDANYLYLCVTESLPKVRIADVMLDPSGNYPLGYDEQGDPGYTGDITEANASYALALRVQEILEERGVKAFLTRGEQENAGYAGSEGRAGQGYEAQAKIFLTLAMDDSEASRPYLLSSPFTNGLLANQLSISLQSCGIELEGITSLTQLNAGCGYDGLYYDGVSGNSVYSMLAPLRETGGKATSAGGLYGWDLNEEYSQSEGMNSVVFYYASTQDPQSIEYYVQHQEEIAQGLAQGIIEYASVPELEEE